MTINGWTSPGANDVQSIFHLSAIPSDLSGFRVLDVGTTNGAIAFECERRGASSIVATDICPPDVFGFDDIRKALGSSVHFVQASIYELPSTLRATEFDVVIAWGVLYHLRHPLLGLDALYQVAKGLVSVETLISGNPGCHLDFFRLDEAHGDGSNWFAPTEFAMKQMFASSGFEQHNSETWGIDPGMRMLIEGNRQNELPEYLQLSYERQIADVTFSDVEPQRIA